MEEACIEKNSETSDRQQGAVARTRCHYTPALTNQLLSGQTQQQCEVLRLSALNTIQPDLLCQKRQKTWTRKLPEKGTAHGIATNIRRPQSSRLQVLNPESYAACLLPSPPNFQSAYFQKNY
ncbi:hypothetical protein ATANTOWER_031135 [Ataeniobius toweri]|uniref:Uncharacterized protein n=1 Tax=Ataeniobius toweri TaxID=208326 RepID=A0ABU7ARN6_9TELE|nr:hypothetical protein [Ataeniobius toweri]